MSMPTEISHLLSEALVHSSWVRPESQVIDNEEMYKIINFAAPHYFLNAIYRTQIPELNSEKTVRAHFDSFKNHRLPFRWYTFSHNSPRNLNEMLYALHPRKVVEFAGMWRDTEKSIEDLPADITVEELGPSNLEDYIKACGAGWEKSEVDTRIVGNEIRKGQRIAAEGSLSYLARYKGMPAGTGSLNIADNKGYFLRGCVVPEFRGKGVYKSLVAHRMNVLRNLGVPMALILARKGASAPACEKLGFEVGCTCFYFEFKFKNEEGPG